MSFSLLAGLGLALALVGAAIYFGMQRGGGSPRSGGAQRRASDVPAAPRPTPREPTFAGGGPASAPQQAEMTDITQVYSPPELPPPPPEMLPADICLSVKFYGRGAPIVAAAFDKWQQWLEQAELPPAAVFAYNPEKKIWETPPRGAPRPHWVAAVPLASRRGALSPEKFEAVEGEAHRFAREHRLYAVLTPRDEALENARLLDQFCAEVDIVVTLLAASMRGASHPRERVAELARSENLREDGRDRFAYFMEGERLFTMHLAAFADGGGSEVTALMFALDAPNVSNPLAAHDAMTLAAEKMAKVLHLTLTDMDKRPLRREDLTEVRTRLAGLARKMRDTGVVAGSPQARMLFS